MICPICGKTLTRGEKSFSCIKRHSFDLAKQGYVNLLPVQNKKSLHPGDTKEMLLARREFLNSGIYMPICSSVTETAYKLLKNTANPQIVDIGCGEGYYSSQLAQAMNAELTGLDISKEAVRCAAAKYKNALWLCGTAAHLPVADHSAGLITSLFALTMPEEFKRVLTEDGYYFQVLAAQDHLLGLKSIIYPELKLKEKDSVPDLPGFELVKSVPIRFDFTVEGQQVQNLLSMTPHVYRISKEGAARLAATERLSDTASAVLNVYRPVL